MNRKSQHYRHYIKSVIGLIKSLSPHLQSETSKQHLCATLLDFSEHGNLNSQENRHFPDVIRKIENIYDLVRRRDDGEMTDYEFQEQKERLYRESSEQGIKDKAFPPESDDEFDQATKNYDNAMKGIG